MRTTLVLIALFLWLACGPSLFHPLLAESSAQHYTSVITQIRGQECCGAGGIGEFRKMVETTQKLKLPVTFALRYDTLQDPQFLSVVSQVKKYPQELAAFLEITPALVKESGGVYRGSPDTWYEAQYAYLVGYEPAERKKIIDTYMRAFHKAVGSYPKTTVAWIIDTDSLRYLREAYGVEVHEITREQWGVDSYTLTGGPPHFPYWPSEQWAFMPSANPSEDMPLIVRQTITDPVWNYGDTTSSYTSQPNDYGLKNRGFSYFQHLFTNAHSQPTENMTFALLGLENSMPQKDQEEFLKQLQFVNTWRQQAENRVVLASDLPSIVSPEKTIWPQVLGGETEGNGDSKAWWITTPNYRARLRLDSGELYLSDLRVYDQGFADPYNSRVATRSAYWVAPFVLDGSRFFAGDSRFSLDTVSTDQLAARRAEYYSPGRLTLAKNLEAKNIRVERRGAQVVVSQQNNTLVSFATDGFSLPESISQSQLTENSATEAILQRGIWHTQNNQEAWGIETTTAQEKGQIFWQPFAHPEFLESEREARYPYLYPEVRVRPLDIGKSYLMVSNRYARAGRNPVRLVFSPRDAYGYPVSLETPPTVTTSPQTYLDFSRPHGQTGLQFIDLNSANPGKVEVRVQFVNFDQTIPVYFAPNCRRDMALCLRNPHMISWYVRDIVETQIRSIKEKLKQIMVR